jgi:hypothetical protein
MTLHKSYPQTECYAGLVAVITLLTAFKGFV